MLGITHDLDDYLEKLGCEADRVDRQAVARLAESIQLALLHWVVGEIHARVNQVGRHYREGANAVT